MFRALTIRFCLCALGTALVLAALRFLGVSPGLTVCAYFACMGMSIWLVGSYIMAHEDEIPTRYGDDRRR